MGNTRRIALLEGISGLFREPQFGTDIPIQNPFTDVTFAVAFCFQAYPVQMLRMHEATETHGATH